MKLFLLLAPLFLTKEIEEELCSVSSLQITLTKDDDKVTSTFDDDTTFTNATFTNDVDRRQGTFTNDVDRRQGTFTDDVDRRQGTFDDRRQGIKSCFKTSTSTQTNDYKNSSHKDSDDELFYAIFTFLMFLL